MVEKIICGVCRREFESEEDYEKHLLKIGTTRWCVFKMKERVEQTLRQIENYKDELVERLVAFCILMEANQGIIGKAPNYILEKFNACMKAPNPEMLLDYTNRQKFQEWKRVWKE